MLLAPLTYRSTCLRCILPRYLLLHRYTRTCCGNCCTSRPHASLCSVSTRTAVVQMAVSWQGVSVGSRRGVSAGSFNLGSTLLFAPSGQTPLPFSPVGIHSEPLRAPLGQPIADTYEAGSAYHVAQMTD